MARLLFRFYFLKLIYMMVYYDIVINMFWQLIGVVGRVLFTQ